MTNPNTEDTSRLRKLPLHSEHERLGARFGAFGEWYVPLYYSSVLEEHETVRTGVGVFDISHMGEFLVRGKEARQVVNRWMTNDVEKLFPGRALYSPVCRENGGIVDDIVVMEEAPDHYFIVVNAANIEKDFNWFKTHLKDGVALENISDQIALFAVQGPLSRKVIGLLFDIDLNQISYYHLLKFDSPFGPIRLSETGYTGEEGYEIFVDCGKAQALFKRLMEVGRPLGLKPIGFGARDTLRLESKFLLYGHDMNDETTPLEAGIGWTVGWEKEDFVGKRALEEQKKKGLKRKLVGFEVSDRGIARERCSVLVNGQAVGEVTSGTFSPTLKKSIGLAYVQSEYAQVGQVIEIEVRGKAVQARVVKTPFYKRSKGEL
ncbi:MAG: glycine cleavage system aminomethyltransferase GcvT [Candidatus Omnitrophica bacterium]|nr:glycine cleavage system aminomethyltransferase GcvT [Candidatus Omnitrophota bacterium]